nr:MAG TPA: hypothetical protein [Caudoviricetes sp.]
MLDHNLTPPGDPKIIRHPGYIIFFENPLNLWTYII